VEKITVLLVDDHPLFRQGLRRTLEVEEDLEIIAEVADGKQAVDAACDLRPDVMIVDVNLPSLNGLQVCRRVKEDRPETAIIVLTAYHDEEQLFHAVRAGASAYFPKDVTPDDLVNAIREVARGHYVINDEVLGEPQMATWLLNQFEKMSVDADFAAEMFVPLSPREMEILQYITRGFSNKEVAYALGISRQTVKNHMTSILRKLAVNDRTQAAVYALRHGWIRLQDTKNEPPQGSTS
jgi:DNA-binding NarL/FixJ family response regulator